MNTRDSKGRFIRGAAADIGRRGGRATAQRHGPDHMRQIGKAGYQTTLERYFAGDKERMDHWLSRAGLAAIDEKYEPALRKWWPCPFPAWPGDTRGAVAVRFEVDEGGDIPF